MRRKGQLPPLLDTDDLVVGQWYLVKKNSGDEKYIVELIEVRNVSERTLQQHRLEKARVPPNKRPKLDRSVSQESQKSSPPAEDVKEEAKPDTATEASSSTSKEGSSEKSQTPPSDKIYKLYYVHYDGMDRRLDEWLERDRFVDRSLPASLCSPTLLPTGVENVSHATTAGAMTRAQKRIHVEFHHQQTSYDDMDAMTARLEKEHEQRTKVKNVEVIRINGYDIHPWYYSPYPKSLLRTPHKTLYICDFCLSYSNQEDEIRLHKALCRYRCPPGDEIYRDEHKGEMFAVYEVIGKYNKTYCQSLCLLSKLFLDHKTLYFDVDTFLFYILCEITPRGARIMGHFSKEILSDNNLACIMMLPPYQRKGYGKLLIQISYELSSREGWIGSPEKPLSDLGKVSFRSYWWYRIVQVLERDGIEDTNLEDLSNRSHIHCDDISHTLLSLSLVKYWKGDNIVRFTPNVVAQLHAQGFAKAPSIKLNPDKLRWTPVHTRRSPSSNNSLASSSH